MSPGARSQRLALIALQLAALWPSLPWLLARLRDGSGEVWGTSAWLLAACALATRSARGLPAALWLPCGLLLVYTAAYAFCPPLVRAMLGLLALAATLSVLWLGRRLSGPLAALLLLGLPVEASLQFYLGYPLRFLVAELCVPLLGTLGLDAVAQGTQLASGGGLHVEVDGPCSGLKMLRVGLLCSSMLALRSGVGNGAWAAHVGLTVAALIAANVLRATSLFVLAMLPEQTELWHAGAGIAAFTGVLVLQLVAMRWLSPARGAGGQGGGTRPHQPIGARL